MKIFEESYTGYKTAIDDKKLIIEIPISTLVCAFNHAPTTEEGTKVITGKEQGFAEFIAMYLHTEIDQETGASHITDMLDKVFECIGEGFYDASDFVNFPEDY